jgi:uroporphyrin-III C-methyltransferase/precorrin-2 dehydrogenase/sirohydrochlorin ferrochelatase
LTLRAQRVLQEADVIVYDRLVPEAILAQGRRDARRVFVGKAKGRHSASQDEINAILVREARNGNRVVRLKSGDPLIFGRAGEEMAALRAAGISFDVVPGVTAAFAAAAEAEIPLTLRDTASSLVFATGQDADGETLPDWAGLALSGATVAVYMGRSVGAKVAARLVEAGLNPSTPVVVIENASRPDRRTYAGHLAELAALAGRPELTGPVLIIVGEVVAAGAVVDEPATLAELAA